MFGREKYFQCSSSPKDSVETKHVKNTTEAKFRDGNDVIRRVRYHLIELRPVTDETESSN